MYFSPRGDLLPIFVGQLIVIIGLTLIAHFSINPRLKITSASEMTALTCARPSDFLLNPLLLWWVIFSFLNVFPNLSLYEGLEIIRKWGHYVDYTSLVLSDDRDCSLIRQAVPLSPCHQIKHKCVANRHRECEKSAQDASVVHCLQEVSEIIISLWFTKTLILKDEQLAAKLLQLD